MTTRRVASAAVLGLLAGCGGGGAYQQPPPPIAVPRTLVITLVAAGNVPTSAQEFPSPSRTINSQADYDLLAQGRLGGVFNIPATDSTVDFTTTSIFYLEGTPDNDPAAAVRALSAVKNANGTFGVSSEACGLPIVTTGIHRPWAIYKTEAGMTSATFAWSQKSPPGCTSIAAVPPTIVAEGNLPASSAGSAVNRKVVIASQADWTPIQSRVTGSLPGAFTPDFSNNVYVYAEQPDNDPTSYVRFMSAARSQDGSVDVGIEHCAQVMTTPNPTPNHLPFALYSFPKPAGTTRVTVLDSSPPSCLTTR